ncbi:hypothetical protein CSB37_00355 [bacterium DOLZORAL124_38_8]|nr:MAG: hypothetical protein CSB37_00355 [bacterium DOLZORAL124_38_8]
MKFLSAFNPFSDDFRRGMLFVEGDDAKQTQAGNEEQKVASDLEKIPATKADIEEIKNLLAQEKTSGLSDDDRKRLRELQQRAQTATNNLSNAVDDILSGKKIAVPTGNEVTEKTETAEQKEGEKTPVEKTVENTNEVVAKVTEEKKPEAEKPEDEKKAEEADKATAQSIKDDLDREHNQNREHESDLAGYKERYAFAKNSQEKIDKVAGRIEHEEPTQKTQADFDREAEDRENLSEAGQYETEKLKAYDNFLKEFLDADTKKLAAELDKDRKEIFGTFLEFQNDYEALSKEENVFVRRLNKQDLERKIKNFIDDFRPNTGKHWKKLRAHRDKIVARLNQVFDEDPTLKGNKFGHKNRYAQYFVTELKRKEDAFGSILQNLEQGVRAKANYNGSENFWEETNKRAKDLASFYNFNTAELGENGEPESFFQRDIKFLKQDVQETVDGTEYLESQGFWKNKAEFEKNLKESQGKLRDGIAKHEALIRKLEKRLNSKWGMSDEAFADRFGSTREKVAAEIDNLKEGVRKSKHNLELLADPNFYDDWLDKYNETGKYNNKHTRSEAIRDASFFKNLIAEDGFLAQLSDQNEKIEEFLNSEKQVAPPTMVSLYDIYKMFEGYVQKREEDWESRSKLAVATIGEKFADKDSPIHSKFAREKKNQEEAEKGEQDEVLKNRSTGEIKEKFLYETSDIFMFWAAVETLRERSDFVWRDQFVLKTINRISGYDYFKKNDWKNLSNDTFRKKIEDWIRARPELGDAKANMWTDDYFADGMIKADDDYAAEADLAVANKAHFLKTVSEAFEDFATEPPNAEKLAKVDKGYILSFMRLALKRRKMNSGMEGDDPLWLLIQGLAIGFFSPADIQKIESEYKGGFPPLSFLIDSRGAKKNGRLVDKDVDTGWEERPWDMQDFRIWARELNGGTMPTKASDFLMNTEDKKQRFREFYVHMCDSVEVDSTFYNSFAPNIKKADFADLSLWATKFRLDNATEVLQSTSDGTLKIRSDGWEQLLSGYPKAIEECWRQYVAEKEYYQGNPKWDVLREKRLTHLADMMRAGLTFTETLVGNGVFSLSRPQAVTLAANDLKDTSRHMDYRRQMHGIVDGFFDLTDEGDDYRYALKHKLAAGYPPEAPDDEKGRKAFKEEKVQAKIFDLVGKEKGNKLFNIDNVEKVLEKRFASIQPPKLNLLNSSSGGRVISMNPSHSSGGRMAA